MPKPKDRFEEMALDLRHVIETASEHFFRELRPEIDSLIAAEYRKVDEEAEKRTLELAGAFTREKVREALEQAEALCDRLATETIGEGSHAAQALACAIRALIPKEEATPCPSTP